VFKPPATEQEVLALEHDLGVLLPQDLCRTLLMISHHVEFRWFAPDAVRFPAPFACNFSGDLHLSLELLRQFERDRLSWIETDFLDKDNAYNVVWHDKLAFREVGNGDYITIDLSPQRAGAVCYLSHDDGEGHGRILAPSVSAFLTRWVIASVPWRRGLAMDAFPWARRHRP
jgi:cell wall assembly regulator SMI1